MGDLDFHRLQAASAAERAVSIDEATGDGFEAAHLYETAARHLSQIVETTGMRQEN